MAGALIMLVMIGALTAQEFRGSISGQITDTSGATIPGAQVVVTHTSTNTAATTTSDEAGNYKVLYLSPGQYVVSVEHPGFRKLVRQGLEVRVGDQIALDLKLEVGAVQDTISVSADAPLLETSTASAGQVIDQRRISDLPLSDGNPFTLSRLATGIAYTGDLKFSRPFDNGGTSSIVADGAPGGNEFTLDGSPNMASDRRVAFVPPADVVQEFKVQTANFDAQQGHTAGATVNVVLKSGTNRLHGTLYEFIRNDKLSANDFFLNRGGQPRAQLRYNRYGGTVGGPIWLPKLYDGRGRTFFFFGYEGLKDRFPEPGLYTVPTEAERRGDFSALLPSIVIYDPLTARPEAGGRIRRDPFPNNVIQTDRLSAIAQNYLKYYPLPNQPGDAQGRNNYLSSNVRGDDFDSETYRFDHQLTDRQQMFFRYTHNYRVENRGNWTGAINGAKPTGNFLFRINNAGTFDHVYTISPSTVLNYRVGFSRFSEPSRRQHEGNFNPASLGFSAATAAYFNNVSYFPRFEIGRFSVLGDSLGGGTTFNIYSFEPTLTKIVNRHSLRLGYGFRAYRENSFGPGHAAGRYDFGSNFTRGPLDNSTTAPIGQELAAFLLGQPTGGFIDRNTARSNQTLYNAVFFQDDWKVNDRLTLNLGLRYEYESPTTERYNRNVRGFDFVSSSPIEAVARAAYAANPIPEVAPADFRVRGGLLFATPDMRGFFRSDKSNFQPRIGLAYRMTDKTVLRSGWGIYTIPFIIDGVNQLGFSQATNIVASLDNGLTFNANLNNPFPNGIAAPPGASQGLATFIGRGVGPVPLDRIHGKSQRWEIGFQHELPGQWLVEAAYVGNRAYDLTTGVDLNPIPKQYLATNPYERDLNVVNFLTQLVPNPFRGLAPGTNLGDDVTIQRQQLLRPYPQFTGVGSQRMDGSSIYHSAQLRVERRFAKGYTLLSSYTWSKLLEKVSFLNATDQKYEKRISGDDIPHRLVVSGIWEIPFGRGRHWGNSWNRVTDAFLGGWQVQGIWQVQSGRPIGTGNWVYFGDPSKLRVDAHNIDNTFDISRFYYTDATVRRDPSDPNSPMDPARQRADQRIQLANNLRTFPTRLSGFRGQGLNLWDLSIIKHFSISESMKFQVRGEFLNAFNHPQFDNPNTDPTSSNFGKITNQNNLPRNVQIGLKLVF